MMEVLTQYVTCNGTISCENAITYKKKVSCRNEQYKSTPRSYVIFDYELKIDKIMKFEEKVPFKVKSNRKKENGTK